jgi:hypothetical protein
MAEIDMWDRTKHLTHKEFTRRVDAKRWVEAKLSEVKQ